MNRLRIAIMTGLILGALVPQSGRADVVPASVPTPGPAGRSLGLDLTLLGSSNQTPALKTLLFGPAIDLVYRDGLSDYVDVRADLAAEFFTGSATGVVPNDMMGQVGPRQTFRLREALIDVHDSSHVFTTKFGAINQREFKNPLLGGDIVFLGAMTQVEGATEAGHLHLKLQGAVPPTSFSLLETAAAGKTPTALQAQIGDRVGREDQTFVGVTAGYFQFDSLTTAQARQSLFWGNTITGPTNSAAFYLPYRGIEGGLRAGLKLTRRWQGTSSVNVVQNTAAPAGAGLGYMGTLGANYTFRTAKLGFSGGYLYDQSDSSPAVFSDGFLNSKNHRGFVVDVNYDAGTYSVFVRGVSTQALVPQLYAGDNVSVLVGVKVHYDFLD